MALAPWRRRVPTWPWALLAAAALLWAWTVATTHLGDLSALGLAPALPPTYYAALALTLTTVVVVLRSPVLPRAVQAGSVVTLTVILFGTAPALEPAPRYAYTYKHIGVTDYISQFGHVDTSIDIYHRWPGFFALAAWFSSISGFAEPTSYAAWAEVFFSLVDAVLVYACVEAVSGVRRRAYFATVVFTLANWVGQNYFAPQALGFALMLGMMLVVVLTVRRRSTRFGGWLERRLRVLLRAPERAADDLVEHDAMSVRLSVSLLVLMDAVLAASHQLTPYVVLLQLGTVLVVGWLRPRWVVVPMAAATVGWLLPNLSYIATKYGLLSLDSPTAPVGSQTDSIPVAAERLISLAAMALFALSFLLGFAGLVRRARDGHLRQALLVGLLAFTPVLTLAGNSYGGEGRLRVYLYGLPWCALGASWLWWRERDPAPGRPHPAWRGATAHLLVLVPLFLLTFYGHEDQNYLSKDEVAVAALISDGTITKDSVVAAPTSDLPPRYGPRPMANPNLSDGIVYLSDLHFGRRHLMFADRSDLDAMTNDIRNYAGQPGARILLVFTRAMENWARDYQYYRPGEMDALESAVARDGRWTVLVSTPTARVYELPAA